MPPVHLRLNESPYEKVGKSAFAWGSGVVNLCLNESPYEKVGKFYSIARLDDTYAPQ